MSGGLPALISNDTKHQSTAVTQYIDPQSIRFARVEKKTGKIDTPCAFFIKGSLCNFGAKCRFLHIPKPENPKTYPFMTPTQEQFNAELNELRQRYSLKPCHVSCNGRPHTSPQLMHCDICYGALIDRLYKRNRPRKKHACKPGKAHPQTHFVYRIQWDGNIPVLRVSDCQAGCDSEFYSEIGFVDKCHHRHWLLDSIATKHNFDSTPAIPGGSPFYKELQQLVSLYGGKQQYKYN